MAAAGCDGTKVAGGELMTGIAGEGMGVNVIVGGMLMEVSADTPGV